MMKFFFKLLPLFENLLAREYAYILFLFCIFDFNISSTFLTSNGASQLNILFS